MEQITKKLIDEWMLINSERRAHFEAKGAAAVKDHHQRLMDGRKRAEVSDASLSLAFSSL
jgi:hypothetical protein